MCSTASDAHAHGWKCVVGPNTMRNIFICGFWHNEWVGVLTFLHYIQSNQIQHALIGDRWCYGVEQLESVLTPYAPSPSLIIFLFPKHIFYCFGVYGCSSTCFQNLYRAINLKFFKAIFSVREMWQPKRQRALNLFCLFM